MGRKKGSKESAAVSERKAAVKAAKKERERLRLEAEAASAKKKATAERKAAGATFFQQPGGAAAGHGKDCHDGDGARAAGAGGGSAAAPSQRPAALPPAGTWSRKPVRCQILNDTLQPHQLTKRFEAELARRNSFLGHVDPGGHCLLEAADLLAHRLGLAPSHDGTKVGARVSLAKTYLDQCTCNGVQELDITCTVMYMRDIWKATPRKGRGTLVNGAQMLGLPSLWDADTGEVHTENVRECFRSFSTPGLPDAMATGFISYVYEQCLAKTSISLGENLMTALATSLNVRLGVLSLGNASPDDPAGDFFVATGPWGSADDPLVLLAHILNSACSNFYNHYAAILHETGPARSADSAMPREIPYHNSFLWTGQELSSRLLPPRTARKGPPRTARNESLPMAQAPSRGSAPATGRESTLHPEP